MKSPRKSHTHLQFARADTRPKIAKEYVFANADRKTEKRKHIPPTMGIRNAGESADMKVITLNKLTAKRKVKCLENPQYV